MKNTPYPLHEMIKVVYCSNVVIVRLELYIGIDVPKSMNDISLKINKEANSKSTFLLHFFGLSQ